MQKVSISNKILFVATIAINLLLAVAIVFLMAHVQRLLDSDVKINLTEIVRQNRDVVSSRINLEVSNLSSKSEQLGDRMRNESEVTDACLKDNLMRYAKEIDDSKLYIASISGNGFFPDGSERNIAGRQYFILASEGVKNISNRIISRVTGEDIFVISVPLKVKGEIVGTVQKSYSPQDVYALCSLSLFSEQGFMHIVNSSGYIMVSSQNVEYNQEGFNFFRDIYAQGNIIESEKLESDIKNNLDGFTELVLDGEKIFSAYTPVTGIHDWYLISSIAKSAISPNANTVIIIFYIVLTVIVVIFALILFYFFFNKNRQHTQLERIAFVDPVTKGNTYNKFLMEIKNILQSSHEKNFALISFDIDNFKFINSNYGFAFGDKILKQIYSEFSSKLSDKEILARISGDRFVALIDDFSEDRLIDLLTFDSFEQGVSVYISTGIYKINDRTESVNLMVDKARTAAQSIKGAIGKKYMFYSEKFDKDSTRNEHMKRQIKHAIAKGEIQPYYQPKVDISTGKLIGAEALARWLTLDGKIISPGEFIPLCEKTGQIVDIDNCIFEQVLKFLKTNIEKNIPCVPISVNFSRLHLMSEEFVHNISEKLKEYNVPPSLVQIELTESIVFENNDVIRDFVNRLHDKGLRICIDDFGSGYSSLNMLKDIPVDVLKIDKAFLDNTKNLKRQNLILSFIVRMAENLEMDVVIEGVETRENVDLMLSIGCNIAQGYFFAKPMSEERFSGIFKEGKI